MTLNYFLMSSLKCRALTKIVTNLWNQQDTWALILEFGLPILQKEAELYNIIYISDRVASIAKIAERIRHNRQWLSVENGIITKVEKLTLPKPLLKEVLNLIKPIGLEILRWKIHQHFACGINLDVASEICYTQHGTVDKKKTTERLIVDDCFDISTRYRLACVSCLESDVRALWNQLSRYEKKYFSSLSKLTCSKQHVLVKYWTCVIKGDMYWFKKCLDIEFSLNLHLLKISAEEGNKAAVEYFFKKLGPEYKKSSFLDIVSNVLFFRGCTDIYNSDILCFLLSRVDEEQRILVFERYAKKLLMSFMKWPYQSLFMETAKHAWEFLAEQDFVHILRLIVLKVIYGYKDYDYQKLFANFWLQSPISKVKACHDSVLILSLFEAGDEGNIRLLLKDATLVETTFSFSPCGKRICLYLIAGGKWDSLRFFIGECISSKELAVRFKEECEEWGTGPLSNLSVTSSAREKFLQVLDDFSHMFDKKRFSEDRDGPVTKRLARNL